MKKQTLLFIAGSMLAFTACRNNATQVGNPGQEEIDSIVNVRVAALQITMAAHNDSIINALATIKADSMIAAMHGANTPVRTARRPEHEGPRREEPAAPAPNTPTGKNSADQGQPTGKINQSQQPGGEGQPTGKRH